MAQRKSALRRQHIDWNPFARIAIEAVRPEIDGGRYAAKRVIGDRFEVSADIFRDGHDVLRAELLVRQQGSKDWLSAPMHHVDNDRWSGALELEGVGRHDYTIEAWTDVFESWRQEFVKKRDARQDVAMESIEGRDLLQAAAQRAKKADKATLHAALGDYDAATDAETRAERLLAEPLREVMARNGERADKTRYFRALELYVDRPAARFAAWYEMFPRSQGSDPHKGATFDDCIRRLPAVQQMGFDVLYFVPIHPIGRTNRKGRHNTLNPGPTDPGSPYAIGSSEGGHTAVHPELGTLEDFRRLVDEARQHGMEVALDFAIQCAPDHPWIKEHPDWFRFRADGTIKYAENPPKKYQDIVNVGFYGAHREALWNELRDVVLFWIAQGVKTFRVDNPHTKPVPFWEWLIREVQSAHPEAIFLSEAFTRPKMLKLLGKVGFTQSYTYFTWRNFKQELTDYLVELSQSESAEYLRPNFFTSTPDILPPILQRGGRPAFQMRLILAATLSGVYGIYNGFELCEGTAIPDTEEYYDSEKYAYKVWDWDRPGNIVDYVCRVNAARRNNRALQDLKNLRFYPADSDSVLFYGKMTPDRSNMVFVAVNLDPFEKRQAAIEFPLHDMGIAPDGAFEAEDVLSGERHLWRGARQHIHLDPHRNPAAIYRITPR